MTRTVAWILFGAVVAGCGIITNSVNAAPVAGFFIALIATLISLKKEKE